MTKKRDYAAEYRKFQSSETEKKHRAERNKARRDYEKAHGDLPKSKEIDHIKPLSKGGSNAKSNQRVVSRHTNRAKGNRSK